MGEAANKPHGTFPHTYIVLRIDDFYVDSEVENRISPVATYLDENLARDEATRLNGLVGDDWLRYVVLIYA